MALLSIRAEFELSKLLKLVFSILGLWCLPVGAVVFSAVRPQANILPEFTFCGHRICLFTIIPGATTLVSAKAIFNNTNDFVWDEAGIRLYKRSAPFYSVQLMGTEENPSYVNEIELYLRESGITAAIFIGSFGAPCGVTRYSTDGIALAYPGMVLLFNQVKSPGTPPAYRRFDQSLTLSELNLFRNASTCEEVINGSGWQRWRGFAGYYFW